MGFMDGLKKLTQPYDDDDDFFAGSDQSLRPQPKEEAKAPVSAAQMAFESAFADPSGSQIPEEEETAAVSAPKKTGETGGIFGGLKKAAQQASARPKRERTVSVGGKDTSVILFSPKSFDEAGELVNYLQQNLTCVMTLENVPGDMARRLLDFISGIAYAFGGKISPVSAKTYFITPQNVDILGLQQPEQQPESSGHYL